MRWRKDKRRKNEEVKCEKNREMRGRIISQEDSIELKINEVRKESDGDWLNNILKKINCKLKWINK